MPTSTYAAICADPEVMRYIGDGTTRTRAQCADQLRAFEQSWSDRSFGLFALELTRTGELIGFIGLAIPDFLPEIMPAVEIGWRLPRTGATATRPKPRVRCSRSDSTSSTSTAS